MHPVSDLPHSYGDGCAESSRLRATRVSTFLPGIAQSVGTLSPASAPVFALLSISAYDPLWTMTTGAERGRLRAESVQHPFVAVS